MPHARYVGSDKRSLGGTWQRIKPPSRNATVASTFIYTRQDSISTSTTEESIAKDTKVNIAR